MGAHHYKLDLMPRDSVGKDPESEDLWTEQPSVLLLTELRALLPKDTSWGDVEEYESDHEWGSDLRIWHHDQHDDPVWPITLRYAPIADDVALLNRFLSLAADQNLLVYSHASKRWLEPQFDEVLRDLLSTPAFQMLSDPDSAIVRAATDLKRSNS